MKKSLKKTYQTLLIIFFVIMVLQSVLLLVEVRTQANVNYLRNNIQMLVIFFLMLLFIYFIVIFYYIPFKFNQGLREIHNIINEISEGKYEIDLEYKTHNQSEEIVNLIHAMHRMLTIIMRFDSLKADKIYEHHQRILQLINMIPQGCLIINIIGEIVYLNNFIQDNFPELAENLNIMETLLPEYLEDSIKPVIIESLKTGSSIHDKAVKIDGTEYMVNASIVRNRKSQPTGAIFLISPK